MNSQVETRLSRLLQEILADTPNGEAFVESERFQEVLSALEYFLSAVLEERHPEWKYESLDGIFPLVARKTRDGELEILGDCILISDQTRTPFQLLLQLDQSQAEIGWLDLRLGQLNDRGMVRVPCSSRTKIAKRLHGLLDGGATKTEWAYQVTLGERRD